MHTASIPRFAEQKRINGPKHDSHSAASQTPRPFYTLTLLGAQAVNFYTRSSPGRSRPICVGRC